MLKGIPGFFIFCFCLLCKVCFFLCAQALEAGAHLFGARPGLALNGLFGFSLGLCWVCLLGGAGRGLFTHLGGPLGGHQFIFSWPDALLFDF